MHKKPIDLSERTWRTAEKIIRFVGTLTGGLGKSFATELSVTDIALGADVTVRTVERVMPILVRDRIIGRHFKWRGKPALTWVCDPSQQIIHPPEPARTSRVAAVLPQIRQALLSDRQSLRPVAKQFGVSLDTVLDERRKVAPYDANSAATKRCPSCGATITSERCLKCTLTPS